MADVRPPRLAENDPPDVQRVDQAAGARSVHSKVTPQSRSYFGAMVSVVLPVRNQADHLARVVTDYLETLQRLPQPAELLLVVNASTDSSAAVAQGLAGQHPSIRVVTSDRSGWGHAVRLGLRQARGDLLCYTNSARTAPGDLLLVLLYATAYPEVVVKANRRLRDRWWRRLGSLLYNVECRVLFDFPQWDVNGTPKVFPREFAKLLDLSREDDLIDLEFNVICRRQNYPMVEVPILASRRHGGRSSTGIGSAFRMYWGALQLRLAFR